MGDHWDVPAFRTDLGDPLEEFGSLDGDNLFEDLNKRGRYLLFLCLGESPDLLGGEEGQGSCELVELLVVVAEGQLDGMVSKVVPNLRVDMVLCHLTTIKLLYTFRHKCSNMNWEIIAGLVSTPRDKS